MYQRPRLSATHHHLPPLPPTATQVIVLSRGGLLTVPCIPVPPNSTLNPSCLIRWGHELPGPALNLLMKNIASIRHECPSLRTASASRGVYIRRYKLVIYSGVLWKPRDVSQVACDTLIYVEMATLPGKA